MPAVVIVGAQWGDEGKGKIVDFCTEHADMVVRYAGGPNAGHTLVVGNDKLIVRSIPSGMLRPDTPLRPGAGDGHRSAELVSEIDELERRGLSPKHRLIVSDRAHVILPFHVRRSTASAKRRPRGRSPWARPSAGSAPPTRTRLGAVASAWGFSPISPKAEKHHRASALRLGRPPCKRSAAEIPRAESIVEGLSPLAQAHRLRCSRDTSRTVVRRGSGGKERAPRGGAGHAPRYRSRHLPVRHLVVGTSAGARAQARASGRPASTRCSASRRPTRPAWAGGLFPPSCTTPSGDKLRKDGAEFGSVTGRPRRTGWLDLPALRYAARVNGLDGLAVTKLDVLTGLRELKVCVAYDTPQGRTDELPIELLDQPSRVTPVYQSLEGWSESLSEVRSLEGLPRAARAYLNFLEQKSGVPLHLVSVGPRRSETIILKNPFLA